MPSEVFLEEGEGAGAQAALRGGEKKKEVPGSAPSVAGLGRP